MKVATALLAGVIAAAILSVLAAIGRGFGIGVDLEMLSGSLLTADVNFGTWLLGLLVHLFASALIALAYAMVFEFVFHRATAPLGMLVALVHAAIAGLLLGGLDAIHPLVPQGVGEPGVFLAGRGAAAVAMFVLLHLVFGALVGSMYGPVRRPPRDA